MRPYIKTRCVADNYANKRCERIAEFDGGLIRLNRAEDGKLYVSLYRLENDVRVFVDPAFLVPESRK